MSEIETNLSFPLDDDGFFRRECPFCRREFKLLLDKDELTDLAQAGLESFMIELNEAACDSDEGESPATEFCCPYCEQWAPTDSWWTQEQLAYVDVAAQNIVATLVNEQLIRPLKRTCQNASSGLVSVQFEGKEMGYQEPWISPEVNDMETFDLPCCERKIKIEDDWTGVVHCFFCGFPHRAGSC